MNDLLQKMRRMEKLLAIKKQQHDAHVNQLAMINKMINDNESVLDSLQSSYRMCADHLNQLRQDPERRGVEIFEDSLSFTKEKWMRSFERRQVLGSQKDQIVNQTLRLKKQMERIDSLHEDLKLEINKVSELRSQDEYTISKAAIDSRSTH